MSGFAAARAQRLMKSRCGLTSGPPANGVDAYNYPVASTPTEPPVFADEDLIACRIQWGTASEDRPFTTQVATDAATLYVPLGTNVETTSLVYLVIADGERLATPLRFQIVGTPQPEPFGIRLTLKVT